VVLNLIISYFASTAQKPDYSKFLAGDYWKRQALNEVIPFWIPTKDETGGGYFTDVRNDGLYYAQKITSNAGNRLETTKFRMVFR
jgi:mannose/cellobiose epimerase-like protein (N-acyl-D-glucosamine 2-epimerase family)